MYCKAAAIVCIVFRPKRILRGTAGRLAGIARSWDLVPTGGSDYHGPDFKEGRVLGSAPVPYESVERVRRAWALNRTTR